MNPSAYVLSASLLGLAVAAPAHAAEPSAKAKATVAAPAPAAPTAAPDAAAPAPAASEANPDAYLDADFPNAGSEPVEPPVAGPPRPFASARTSEQPVPTYVYHDAREPEPRAFGPKVVERGPFLLGTLDAMTIDSRYDLVSLGITGGVFFADRLRATITIAAPFSFDVDSDARPLIDDPHVLFNGTFGFALVRRHAFAMSLVADVSTTDSTDLGWNVGASLPLEWVAKKGFRFTVMPGLLENIGASDDLSCDYATYDGTGAYSGCASNGGTSDAQIGLHLQISAGYTFD